MKRSYQTLAASIGVFLLCCYGLRADVFYVCAETGQDDADGSSSAPWQTLQHAANQVATGDTVVVRAGVYAGFNMESKSGSQGEPITFRALPGVTINAENPASFSRDGIYLFDCHYVVIEGFHIDGADGEQIGRDGIRAVGASAEDRARHITIRDNTITGCQLRGIFTGFVDHLLIEGNETSGSVSEHGIYVSNTCSSPIIRKNTSFGNRASGIQLNGDAGAGGIGLIDAAVIARNRIFANGAGGGAGINLDGVVASRIENNLLYDNRGTGVALFRQDGGSGSSDNIVVNNTVVNAADGRWALSILGGSTNNVVFNNILYTHYPNFRGAIVLSADSMPGFSSNHNALMNRMSLDGGETNITLHDWRSHTGQDASSFVSQPADLFVDPAAGNYRLLRHGPGIDAGSTLMAPSQDIEGRPRPYGDAVDLGAYEWHPSTVVILTGQ